MSAQIARAKSSESNANWMGLAGGGVLLASLLLAATSLQGPVCLSRALFHVPCPGCGLTRSLVAIWHGDAVLSLRYHPFGLPLFVVCGIASVRALTGNSLRKLWARMDVYFSGLRQKTAASVILAALVGLWLIRMFLWSMGVGVFLW